MEHNNTTARLPKAEYLKKKREEKKEFINNKYPEHLRNLVYLLKNNSEIRRFTAKNVLAHLESTGDIPADTKSKIVQFNWDKFSVICDGLGTDYRYTEKFLLTSLVDSFSNLADSATKTIKEFMDFENISL